MKRKNKIFVDLNHARNDRQREIMEKIAKDGVCPFCPENLLKYHSKPIIKETDWWFLTENMNPYEGARVHLLLIYKKHVELPNDVSPEGLKDLFGLIDWAIKKFKIAGGALLIRFGETGYAGGSVNHLHVHLIAGSAKINDPDAESLKVKVGYKRAVK